MPVTNVTTDPESLTMTFVADFPVAVERLWDAYADPRKLERFWGPPGYPATFERHDLRPGGGALYRMTSPEGEHHYGVWEFTAVEPLRSFEVVDSFADEHGTPNPDLPGSRMTFTFEATDTGSRLTTVSTMSSLDDLERLVAMGAVEGTRQAMAQLDVVLADLREYALGKGVQVEVLDDTHVRITRAFDAPRELIWRAHTEPELMRRWLLGPDGWRMSVCEIDPTPGGAYRYRWEPEAGVEGEAFGFEGETVVSDPPRRAVTTEAMSGTDFPPTVNDMTLDEVDGVTLLTLLITYADLAQRDAILATGMTDGMEASYARLERELLPTG